MIGQSNTASRGVEKHPNRVATLNIWDKVFKHGPSEICGRPPLKKLR